MGLEDDFYVLSKWSLDFQGTLSGASQDFADAYPMIVLEKQHLHLWYVTSAAKGITFFFQAVLNCQISGELCFLQDFPSWEYQSINFHDFYEKPRLFAILHWKNYFST